MATTTAHNIAIELRKLADLLDREPESLLPRPEIAFSCKYGVGTPEQSKTLFLATAKVFPHPFTKGAQSYDDDALELRYTSDALIVTTCILQNRVCKLIEKEKIIPAVYDCEPLLSVLEMEAVDASIRP